MSDNRAPAGAQEHELKTDPAVFQAVIDGRKTFEIRLNDRDFHEGDGLLLKETRFTGAEMKAGAPLEYTGRECYRRVSHVLRGPIYGLADGWAILSLSAPTEATDPSTVAAEPSMATERPAQGEAEPDAWLAEIDFGKGWSAGPRAYTSRDDAIEAMNAYAKDRPSRLVPLYRRAERAALVEQALRKMLHAYEHGATGTYRQELVEEAKRALSTAADDVRQAKAALADIERIITGQLRGEDSTFHAGALECLRVIRRALRVVEK